MRLFTNTAMSLLLLALAVGCDKEHKPVSCPAPLATMPTSDEVCAHLAELGCGFEGQAESEAAGEAVSLCATGYTDWSTRVSAEDFARVTSCYVQATSCTLVQDCNVTCGPNGGPVTLDAGPPDSGTLADSGADAASLTDSGMDANTTADSGTDAATLTDSGMDANTVTDANTATDSAP